MNIDRQSERARSLVSGSAALVALLALVIGLPLGLAIAVGWPLPHQIPTVAGLRSALTTRGIPDRTLLDALACVAWLAWASAVLSIAEEIVATSRGRSSRRIVVAGAFQPAACRLVAAVLFATLALARPQPTATSASRTLLAIELQTKPVALTAEVLVSPQTSLAQGTPSVSPLAEASVQVTYTVVRHDTLWSIAQNQLGDPLRWRELFALNEGRPQPDGRTLTDPNWIYPGWVLVLSTAPASSVEPPAPSSPQGTSAPLRPLSLPSRLSPKEKVPSAANNSRAGALDAGRNGHALETRPNGIPVRLPSGSMVAGSFAAGVLCTVALCRLRRRHAYRYRPPDPGRDLTPERPRPTLRHLAHAYSSSQAETTEHESVPLAPFADDERHQEPGRLEVGTHQGHPVTIEVTDLSGVAVSGPAVDSVARALLAGLLVRAGPGAAEVLLPDDVAARLIPHLAPDTAVRRTRTADDAARIIETERIARTRRLASVGALDAGQFRHENPENPLPALIVLLNTTSEESLGRWAALLTDNARLGIAVLFLGESPIATARVVVDASCTVTDCEPLALSGRLSGTQLYGLRADEAVELLSSVTAANDEPDDRISELELGPQLSVLQRNGSAEDHSPPARVLGEPWTETAPQEDSEHALVVNVLGPYQITAFGEAVTTGLRGRAKVLLAWSLLRPEGAIIEQIVDSLWPDTAPDRVTKQFWYALGDLRTYFRGPAGETLDVLEKIGEHYRPNPSEIACDLWDFQSALGEAARTTDDGQSRVALRRGVDVYGGDLLAGSDYLWVEPIRQDLHRRALDAHLRLAELEDRIGRPDAAVDILDRIINIDRYAEEPYRRLMALHAAHGRSDAVTSTWKLLQRRLADLDLDVEDTTVRLYRTLTNPDPENTRPRPIRLTS